MNRVTANLLRFCVLLITAWTLSCGTKADLKGEQDPTAFRVPVTKSFALSEPKPIEWEVTDPDSIAPPKSYPLDIDKLPSRPFSINEFKPLKSPMEESPLDFDEKNRIPLQFDTLSIERKTSILPTPIVSRMERPQVLEGTSSGLLRLSTNEGLPSNEIRQIIQNEDGTYWIATFDGGLCLYNGSDIYTYDYLFIWDIVKDQDGKLWVATANNGVYVLDFENKTETHFLSNTTILRLYCDHQNVIWIGHWLKGTYVMDSEMKHLRQITNPGFEVGFPVTEDRDHNIWLSYYGSNQGVVRQGVVRVIGKDRVAYTDILDRGAGYFFQDHENRMWMSSGAVNTAISLENKTVTTLNEKHGFYGAANLYEEDNQGRLWFIKNDTIQVLSKDHTQLKTIVTNSPVSLTQKFGCSIKDERGVIWIGTLTKGILLVDPDGPLSENLDESNGLINSEIWSFEEDHQGDIWLGTRAGINIYSPSGGTLKAIDHSTLRRPGSNIISFIKEFEKDKIFVDGTYGFNIIDRTAKRMTRYIEEQNIATQIFEAIKDEEGTYWLATVKGLAVYNPELNWLKAIPDTSAQIAAERVRCIVEDGSGHYWLGTTNGLVILDPDKNTLQHLREEEGLCNNNIMKILLREDGKLWVATFNGISIIDPVNQSITKLGEAEGLIPDEIYDIREKEGTIYIGSVNGLIQVKPPTDQNTPWDFYHYGAAQGFPSNDYKRNAGLVRSKGQLWFGTSPVDKLTILTQDPVPDTIPCPVSITALSIMDDHPSFESMATLQPYFETADSLWSSDGTQLFTKNTLPQDSGYVFENNIQWDSLSSPYKMPLGLQLPYDQNYLRFSFANLCVLNRDKVLFRYMLSGADESWIYAGQESESKNYFNLSAGAYTFKVATKSIRGQWGAPTSFSFRIFPPWWRTWWAYTAYLILTVLALYVLIQWRTRTLVKRSRELESIVSERTAALGKRVEELQVVNHVSRAAVSEIDLKKLIPLIGHEMQEAFHAEVGYIALLDESRQMIDFPYLRGVEVPSLKLGQGLTSRIILSGEALLINENVKEVYQSFGLETVTDVPESYLGVPIPLGDQNIGVLSVSRTEAHQPFDEDDQHLLTTLAANVSSAIRNARLYEEAQLATAAAEEANQAKSSFLSTVSHELRTPLTSVIGFAKIIKKRLEGRIFPHVETEDPKVKKAVGQVAQNLDVVISEGERLTQLINDVLDLAKIEAGKIDWYMEPISISEVVKRAIGSTQSLFEQKPSLHLSTDIPDELPLISGDQNKLIQVLINLLSNAIKFTEEGEVRCQVLQETDHIIIQVIDSGIGIAVADQSRVFEKFKQVGDTLTDKPKGTGLGLPICKEIIEHHGGQIWVHSEIGQGSTFSFSLPLNADGAAVTTLQLTELVSQLKQQILHTPQPKNGKEHTILIVDDESPIRSLLRQELTEVGYRVREAENGRIALEMVREERPDLILLDVMMPELNGFDVAAVLKNDPQTMDIPIIILSILQDQQRGFRIGVDRYLTKPINTEQLFNEMGHLLHQGQSRKKVLVVDEDASTARTLMDVLKQRGYQVDESDGQQVMKKIVADKPDIVILNALLNQNQELIKSLRFEKGLEKILFFIYQ